MPDRTVTLLYADGGTGKGILELQLALARALHSEWIGLLPEPGRTLVLSTEDDIDEMWRRIERMLPFYNGIVAGGACMRDLSDIRLVDLVGENAVLGLLNRGIIAPTEMYHALDAYIAEFKPGLVCLDVLADMFSGEESNRPQVTQFVGLLKRLCIKYHCAILLAAQPSLTGMNTGSGTSGSTGWNNSGRSRLYFQRVKTSEGVEFDKDLRTFEGKKSNYGAIGGKFDLEWKDGLFRRVIGPSGIDKMVAERRADEIFLALLEQFTREGRNVVTTPGKSYAPAEFAAHDDGKGISKDEFKKAMDRLLKYPKIKSISYGPPSTKRNKLVILDENKDENDD